MSGDQIPQRVGERVDVKETQFLSTAGEITAIDYIGSRVEITVGDERHWAPVGKLTEIGGGEVENAHILGAVGAQVIATTTRFKRWQVGFSDLEKEPA